MFIENNYNLNYFYFKYYLENYKKKFKYGCSIIAHILRIDENLKCLLGIVQISIQNLIIK